ncbi:MAG: FtsL-like putative cell division protein [Bacteroidia bacterium]|nr:FtsL-like putative cell division protein [Bacteroidia bacterium]
MQTIITPKNLHKQATKVDQKARKGLKIGRVDDYLRFVVFLALIGMGYIWNSHLAERQVKELETVRSSVKELKSRYLLKRATLGASARFSEIEAAADTLGLLRMEQPPFELTTLSE